MAQAQFSATDVPVLPGEVETLSLTLFNLGDHTETYTLVPSGLLAGWVRMSPPVVTLFGGSHEVINVTLHPPRLSSTAAGPAPLTVRVIPQNEPDDVTIAETTVQIGAFHDRRIEMLQPVLRGRRRATFEFLVENHGNLQASCRLHLIDTTQRLDGAFDPPAIGIEPGAKSLVRLRLKSLHRQMSGESRTLPFSVEADQQGFPTAATDATFVQSPLIGEHSGRRVMGAVAVVGVLAGAWFALAKPVVERAARDAVKGGTSSVQVAPLPGVEAPTDSTVATDGSTPVENVIRGTQAFNRRLVVKVALSASATDQYVVPSGKVLRITDVVLQNPNFDTGPANLSNNDQVLVPWRLENATGNESLPLVSPLVFKGGDKVTFSFTCDSVGDAPTGSCVPAVLLSGTLADS